MHLFRTARRQFARVSLPLLLVAIPALAGGCINGVDGPGTDDTGSITVAVSNPSASVAVGMPAVSAITVTRKDGYAGTVLLGADSLPTGVTVTFEPAALGGLATTSIMTVTAATTAAVAIDTFNVRASGVNVTTDSIKVEVRISSGAISLATPAPGVIIPQGGSGSVPLTITRVNGYVGGVNLLAEGLPPNVIATFTPALLANGVEGSTLVLTALPGADLSTTTVTVRARAPGVPDKTVSFSAFVRSSGSTAFWLRLQPAVVSLVAGGTGGTVVNITRTGAFTGPVTLALGGMPAGITGTFNPVSPTTGSSALTLTAAASVAPGTYEGAVSGSGANFTTDAIPIVVKVTPIPGVRVQVAPSTLSLRPAGITQAAVLLTRVAGFTGDFVMTAEGLPTGLTATFSPAPVIGSATTLTLAATAATVPGTYNIVIKATAGSDFGTFTVPVTVATTALRQ